MPEIYIHELASLQGAPTGTEYLPVDDGTETSKITLDQVIDPTVITLYQSIGWVKD